MSRNNPETHTPGDRSMRYMMMMIKATTDYEVCVPPSPKLMADMGKLTDEMKKRDVLLAFDGLLPSSQGTRISYRGGERNVIDGPFAETKELIGGYAILRTKSKEEAIQLADLVVDAHVKAGVADFEMEIRPLFDP